MSGIDTCPFCPGKRHQCINAGYSAFVIEGKRWEMWCVSQLIRASGLDIGLDVFYDSQSGFLVALDDIKRVNKNVHEWCKENERIFFLLECYMKSGWNWDANFCEPSDLLPILETDWLGKTIKDEATDFINSESKKPKLTRRTTEQGTHGFVYVLLADNGLYKIGRSKCIDNRIKQLSISLPYELEIVCVIEAQDMFSLEKTLHKRFTDKRKGPPKCEWFKLDDADVETLKRLAE